jgi:hypothetical protein
VILAAGQLRCLKNICHSITKGGLLKRGIFGTLQMTTAALQIQTHDLTVESSTPPPFNFFTELFYI